MQSQYRQKVGMNMALQNSSIWNMHTFLGGTYHIPDYQREYSWEAEEIGDFWDDLDATRNDPDKMIHFFGQVVVHSDEEDNKKYIKIYHHGTQQG